MADRARARCLFTALLFRGGWFGLRPVEWEEFWSEELAVLADQFAIEVNFAATVIGPLNADHVPVNLTAVSIICRAFVSLTWSEMERTGDLFIEENVAHRMHDLAIETDGEFTNVAGTRIGIENAIDGCRVVGGGIDDLALAELELDVVERDALIDRWRVVGNDAFHGILDRSGETFAIGNVVLAAAIDGFEPLEAEFQIGSRPLDMNIVGLVHQLLQSLHGGTERGVVATSPNNQ